MTFTLKSSAIAFSSDIFIQPILVLYIIIHLVLDHRRIAIFSANQSILTFVALPMHPNLTIKGITASFTPSSMHLRISVVSGTDAFSVITLFTIGNKYFLSS